jgi:hypothetical protein
MDVLVGTFCRVLEYLFTAEIMLDHGAATEQLDHVAGKRFQLSGIEEAMELVIAANHFILVDLKARYEEYLINKVDMCMVVPLIQLSDALAATRLKSCCLTFAALRPIVCKEALMFANMPANYHPSCWRRFMCIFQKKTIVPSFSLSHHMLIFI